MTYCDRCDKYFTSWRGYDQHVANSPHHNICDDCDLDFPSWLGLKEHWVQSPKHHYCQYCDEHFDDIYDHHEHNRDVHHWCEQCNKFFKNERGLEEHYRQSSNHFFCPPCKRLFKSAANLQSHLNSSVHLPRNFKCRAGCKQTFISNSAMLLHLESGHCPSGATRQLINARVREWDTNNIITDPSRMLTGGTSSSHGQSNTTYYATAASWNGSAYECYFCHATFRTLASLNTHLASPKHQDKIYVCPNRECRIRFTTLSGLCQHIESGSCGVKRFTAVQNALDGIVGAMGRLTM